MQSSQPLKRVFIIIVSQQSGLTNQVRESRITVREAEDQLLKFVREHTPPASCPLAGNSVHADKMFLLKYMPQFVEHLHYRIVDVSTVKELCRYYACNVQH